MTAKDFVYAWQRAINPDTAAKSAYIMYDIKMQRKLIKRDEFGSIRGKGD